MLQRIYGTVWETQEDLDRYLWRLEEAKKRDHRKLGRDLDLFTFHPESPAAPFWHPRGMAMWRALEQWSREVRRSGGFDEVRTPSLVRKELWETVRPLGALPGQHVRAGRPRPRVGPEADELPAGDPDLQDPGALVPRAADPLRRLLGALPQGADRRPVGHVPGAAAGAGRLARLLPGRPGDRRDQPGAGPGAAAVRAVRDHAQLQAGDAAGEAAGLRRVLGHGRGQAEDGARGSRARRTPWIPAAPRSTRPRSTSSSRTPLAGSGRTRPSSSTTSCPSASTWSTGRPTVASSGRRSSTTPSTARSSASWRSSPSTLPAPSRCGWRRCR